MAKLLSALVFIVAVVSVGRYDLFGLVPYLIYPFVLMPASETPYRPVLKRFALALPFAVFAGLANMVFDTAPAFFIGGLGVSLGAVSFLVILIKTYLAVMAVLILAATTTLQELSHQLVRIKVPAVLVMLITMIYRYLSILLSEASAMVTAYTLRSPGARGIRIKHMGSFVGQLLLRSVDRASRVYAAMKCRGYQGAVGYAPKRRVAWRDVVFCVVVVGLSAAFRFIDLTGLIGGLFV